MAMESRGIASAPFPQARRKAIRKNHTCLCFPQDLRIKIFSRIEVKVPFMCNCLFDVKPGLFRWSYIDQKEYYLHFALLSMPLNHKYPLWYFIHKLYFSDPSFMNP